jgi:LuxR family maltose regulon positive regulatory protein
MGVVPTAIARPHGPDVQINRPHLDVMIDAVDGSRVTTICAPAGYGKTITVLRWAEALADRDRPILWLAARAGIGSLDEFVAALISAANEAGLPWGSLPFGLPPHEALARLTAARPHHPVLIVEDAQLLPREVFDLIALLVASAGDSLTTILVSRSSRTIPVARLRSLGHLVEVGVRTLRFSLAETFELISRSDRGPVDAAWVEQLAHDTEGWPAGVAIARAIRRTRRGSNTPARLNGLRREFESYFDEEVISPEPLAIRNFLAATAVLDELTPAACAATTELEDAREMLTIVEETGLFLEATDDERTSYRYHPLFREVLLRRLNDLEPLRGAEFQRRASRFFAATGQPDLALDHAERSGDRAFIADQLELLAEKLTYQGKLYRIVHLTLGMPSTMLVQRPRLALALAWRSIRSLAFESAETLIAMAESDVNARRADEKLETPETHHLLMVIEHLRIMYAAARDKMREVEQRGEPLLQELGDAEPYLSCTLLAQLMTARRELYHSQDMLKLEAEVRHALNQKGSDFAAIALKASIAPTMAVQGRVEAAEHLLREALSAAQSLAAGPREGIAALPALPLAELLYDRGAFQEAHALVETYLPPAREFGFVDQLAAGHIVRARLIFNKGDLITAVKALEETQVLAIECGLDRLRAYAVGELVRMLIRSGEAGCARKMLEASGLYPEAEPYPTLNPTRQNESVAIAWIRIEMQGSRLAQVRKVAKRWSDFVLRNGALRSAMVFELLLAEIAVLSGDRSEAQRAVREAVMLAAAAGWTQVFVDEGEAIGTLLAEAYGQGAAVESVADRFGEQLINFFRGAPAAANEEDYSADSRLVKREIDILRMVSGGLRNREIGNRLGLTEGTVKWYMQQIYDKLGVRRRPQAVTRARQLGLFA